MSDKTPLTLDHVRAMRKDILKLAAKHDATNVRVFGSVARGDAHPESDVDFLLDFPRQRSIFELVALWQDLTALLDCEVDLLVEEQTNDRLMQAALKDAVTLQ